MGLADSLRRAGLPSLPFHGAVRFHGAVLGPMGLFPVQARHQPSLGLEQASLDLRPVGAPPHHQSVQAQDHPPPRWAPCPPPPAPPQAGLKARPRPGRSPYTRPRAMRIRRSRTFPSLTRRPSCSHSLVTQVRSPRTASAVASESAVSTYMSS